jgi:hypothetical protein
MKLKEARESYYYYSGKASDRVRQLAFAGIALIWILKIDDRGNQAIPEILIIAAVFIVAGLGFDLLQYLYGSAAWGIFHRCKENKRTKENSQFQAPAKINWPTNAFFWLKAVSIIISYCFILFFLFNKFI